MRNVVLKTLIGSTLALSYVSSSLAAEKFVFMTNWNAQAEHGGFYQALAEKPYQKNDLDVEIKMGDPQVNAAQIMAAGQVDCILGSTDIQMLQMREGSLPIVNVAAKAKSSCLAITVSWPMAIQLPVWKAQWRNANPCLRRLSAPALRAGKTTCQIPGRGTHLSRKTIQI